MIEVKRVKDNIFKYKYEKSFKLSNSLRKYAKEYNDKLTESKENEEFHKIEYVINEKMK